jgi:NAD(P)H-dependent flavin oxidoreductase YrpB (nitropropane dioxygenase family)
MRRTMWPDRRVIELLQIEHPLVLAPMAGIGTVELAASVCAAGGLGSIGCAGMQPEFAALQAFIGSAASRLVGQGGAGEGHTASCT